MTNIQKNHTRPAETPLYFDDFITRDGWIAAKRNYSLQLANLPATNVEETQAFFIIEIAAPGLTHEDLDIRTTDHLLDIRYEPFTNLFENLQQHRRWHNEYRRLPFRRQFELNPEVVDFSELRVVSEAGLIRFEIPKRPDFQGKMMSFMPFSTN